MITNDQIRLCARLSQLAYATRTNITAALPGINLSFPAYFDAAENSAGFVTGAKDGTRYFVWRGTEKNQRDIFEDIDFPLVSIKGSDAKIHRGFFNRLHAAWPQIMSLFNKQSSQIVLTGHSLGAAEATLAALFAPNPTNISGLVTFGSPRCVNEPAAEAIVQKLGKENIYRYVHAMDIVPRVPIPVLYRHVTEDDEIALGAAAHDHEVLMRLADPIVYEDHRIAAYVQALEARAA